jgi:hypothetical protein
VGASIMAFIHNLFTGNTLADAADVNENFAEIYTELESFPSSNGGFASLSVTEDVLDDGAVAFEKLKPNAVQTSSEGLTATDAQVPTSKAVKEEIENYVATYPEAITIVNSTASNVTMTTAGTRYYIPLTQTKSISDANYSSGDGVVLPEGKWWVQGSIRVVGTSVAANKYYKIELKSGATKGTSVVFAQTYVHSSFVSTISANVAHPYDSNGTDILFLAAISNQGNTIIDSGGLGTYLAAHKIDA